MGGGGDDSSVKYVTNDEDQPTTINFKFWLFSQSKKKQREGRIMLLA